MTAKTRPAAESTEDIGFADQDPNPPANGQARAYKFDPISVPEGMEDLLSDLDRDRVPWVPDVGDQVIGTVLSIEEAENEYGFYPLMVLDVANGPFVMVHGFHTVLKNEIGRAKLRRGDTVAIRYTHKGEGKDAHLYRVAVRRTGRGRPFSSAFADPETGEIEE